jgi:hypothetical protein
VQSTDVIIRGRVERREFQEPFRQCIETLEQIGIPYSVNPVLVDQPADFVLFFQSYPHEFSQEYLKGLRRSNPFAPFFFVLGACCEGMLRTAGPLDSPFYTYVHGWNGRETEQIRLFLTDQPSVFALPMTAENDEIAQWLMPPKVGCRPPGGNVRYSALERFGCQSAIADPSPGGRWATCSPHPNPPPEGEGTSFSECLILTHFGPFGNDSAMNRLLADEQQRLGYAPIYAPIFGGDTLPDAFSGIIVGDMDDSPREKILESIQRLRRQFADNEFAVYADSPRIDEKIDYLRAGVTQIRPKMR